MEKDLLVALVERELSSYRIAAELGCSQTTIRYWLRKYGLVTKSSYKRWGDADLIEAVRASDNMSQVIRRLGLKVSAAGNRTTIKKHVGRLKLDTSHWTGQSWVGTRPCPAMEPKPLDEILVEGSTYSTSRLRERLIAAGLKDRQCENCHLSEWCGSPIVLELDHINGASNDHRLENLRVLCPNCHSLTPTWRGRNKRKKAAVV